ncbi:MAG: Hsp20/alpha crystallin family protein [Candidatus Omnitrophica bacterium]|nr:Hsp20/alpha crystallin family protein [Candidatus Omnitrophota bacterium]
MKRIAIAVIICLLGGNVLFAQTYDNAPVDDQARDEKNLKILSNRLVSMKKNMDKFVNDMTTVYSGAPGTALYGSDVKVDIVENDKDFIVTADLPGMDKDKIDILLEGGKVLKISGMRSVEKKEEAPGMVRQERMEGRFERILELPAECKSEGISASYDNGVLEITIPKKESVKKEIVKVKVR